MSDTQVTAVADPDLSGRRLGDYQILRRLGRGAMADVYLAQQESLRRQVAIKVLKSQLALDDTYVKRFHMEAQAAASLVHANIVQIHDVGCIDGVHFIAQEYVSGLNLREYVTRHGPPDLKLALRFIRQVSAALVRASEQGIVHRDIKPENILLATTGEVKVADFGLARMMRDEASLDLTQIGMTMGTPLYMSPEQVEGKPLDGRSDIYSFGITCYYMLSGQAPFRGDTALSVALQHLNAHPTRLESLRPDLPAGLCRIVHQMLAKDPDARFSSAREVVRSLRALHLEGAVDDDSNAGWNGDEGPPSIPLKLEATQQLANLMRTQAMLLAPRLRRKRWVFVAILAFLVGVLAAYYSRPTYLLANIDPAGSNSVNMGSAELQYNYARLFPSEQAWRAVLSYYGENTRFAPLAQEELAWLYLMQEDLASARELFQKLENRGELEPRFRAFGLAGQAVLFSRDNKPEKSNEKLAELFKLTQGKGPDQLEQIFGRDANNAERWMVATVGALIVKNTHAASAEQRAQWSKRLEDLIPDEPDTLDEAVDNVGNSGLN